MRRPCAWRRRRGTGKAGERIVTTVSGVGAGSPWNLTAAMRAPLAAGGDEEDRHGQQVAAQEDGGEEAILAVADQVADDGDEPQEGDAGERGEVDPDERDPAGVLFEVEVADLCRGAGAGGRVAQEQDRGEEERGEGESGDPGRRAASPKAGRPTAGSARGVRA